MVRLSAGKLLVSIAIVMIVMGATFVGVKLQHDYARKEAYDQLRLLGFGGRIGQFVAPARPLTDDEMRRVLASLEVIKFHHEVNLVDFTESRVDHDAIAAVRALLPGCDVRY